MSSETSSFKRPRALRSGDRVGVFAPAAPLAALFPERFERGLNALAHELGVVPVVAPQARNITGFTSGDRESRAQAFAEFARDPSIRAIFCTIGGFNSAELLPLLEDESFSEPKIVVGYSDCTALLLGLQALEGWITFHGPAVMTQFGEHPAPFDFTLGWLRKMLFDGSFPVEVDDPEAWTNEFLDWSDSSWKKRPRRLQHPANRKVWRDGSGQGRLFGGNIETINLLIGTPYFQPPEDIVLFWEATEAEAYLPRVQRALTHFEQIGLLDRTRAMLIGRSPDIKPEGGMALADVVKATTAHFGFPVVADLAFGHTDPMLTLPLGVDCRVEAEGKNSRVSLLEPGVTVK